MSSLLQSKGEMNREKVSGIQGGVCTDAFLGYRELPDGLVEFCFTKEFVSERDWCEQGAEEGKVYIPVSSATRDDLLCVFLDLEIVEKLKKMSDDLYNLQACMKKMDDEWASMVISISELYFEVLMQVLTLCVDNCQRNVWEFVGYRRILEELLFLNCVRIKNDNKYYISQLHPVLCMQEYAERLTNQDVENLEEEIEHNIIKSVIDNKYKNLKHYKIFTYNQVYEIEDGGELSKGLVAEAFHEIEENTELPALRLAGKIRGYQREHSGTITSIHIACFGAIKNSQQLVDLFAEDNIDVQITSFSHVDGVGKYYFKCQNQSEESTEAYDLLRTSDLQQLFLKYQIVLLLDLNCFYRQHQEVKSDEEKNALSLCQWYMNRAKEVERFQDKVIYYQNIYNYVGKWLNSCESEATCEYEFDEKLYLSMMSIPKQNTDVYLYIRYGNKIAGRSLKHYNVCNDEYYDGKVLTVYKYSQDTDINTECLNLISDEGKKQRHVTTIEFGKLIKSISNSYYDNLSDRLGESVSDVVRTCQGILCGLEYEMDLTQDRARVRYSLKNTREGMNIPQTDWDVFERILDVIIKYAFDNGNMVCAGRYFRVLVANSMISGARDIFSLVFAYMLLNGRLKKIEYTRADAEEESEDIEPINKAGFRARKTLYTMIEGLAGLRIRSMDDREGFFINTLRRNLCPDINEETFREVLDKIHDCCEHIGDVDSRLYYNSKI